MSFRTPVFTAVDIVMREQDALAGCSHVAEMVSEYLDVSHKWTIERAACAGYMTLLERLGKSESPITPRELDWALRTAADRGDLNVVKWLTAYQPDMECSTRVMDSPLFADTSTSSSGPSLPGRGLHDGSYGQRCRLRSTGCRSCGGWGHLKTVQWLAVNRKEGCTSVASHFALLNGHMHILRWLNEQNVEVQDNGDISGSLVSKRTPTERHAAGSAKHRPRRMSMGLSCRN
ncbi:Ankyrin repeat-containing domain [Phytophthora cactorum]|nr:Ankyrin repeat-containing domain [Phytophthora cactorum]